MAMMPFQQGAQSNSMAMMPFQQGAQSNSMAMMPFQQGAQNNSMPMMQFQQGVQNNAMPMMPFQQGAPQTNMMPWMQQPSSMMQPYGSSPHAATFQNMGAMTVNNDARNASLEDQVIVMEAMADHQAGMDKKTA